MKRRWRIPPPPFGALEAADGAAVLEENAGSLGILLWDVVRDVVLWSNSPRSELGELFAPAAERMRMTSILTSGVDVRLESSLAVLARVVGSPKGAKRERAAMACREIAQWADELGALATAYAFAHAAALCCTGDPRLSYEAGRIARRRAAYNIAHAWLSRGVLLGRQLKDWDAYARCFSGLGNAYMHRGDYPRARKYHLRCLRTAVRHQLKRMEGDACHDLLGISLARRDYANATLFARQAYAAFGADSPRLPTLAHDVAYGWMEQGYYAEALAVFQAAKPRFRHDQSIVIEGNICRAAGGLGDSSRYSTARDQAYQLCQSRAGEYAAEALVECARGAVLMGEWAQARDLAARADEIAVARKEHRVRFLIEELVDTVDKGEIAAPGVADAEEAPADVVLFADELVGCLAGATVALV
jgi:tetratricopeptide (TPR) repeat protein